MSIPSGKIPAWRLSVFHKFFWNCFHTRLQNLTDSEKRQTFSWKTAKKRHENNVSVTRIMAVIWLHIPGKDPLFQPLRISGFPVFPVEKPNFSTLSTTLSTGEYPVVTIIFIHFRWHNLFRLFSGNFYFFQCGVFADRHFFRRKIPSWQGFCRTIVRQKGISQKNNLIFPEKFLKKGLILWKLRAIMHTCMNTFGNRRCNHAQH